MHENNNFKATTPLLLFKLKNKYNISSNVSWEKGKCWPFLRSNFLLWPEAVFLVSLDASTFPTTNELYTQRYTACKLFTIKILIF